MLNKNEEAKLTQQHMTNEMVDAKLYIKLVSVYVFWEQLIFRLMHGHIIIFILVNKHGLIAWVRTAIPWFYPQQHTKNIKSKLMT